MERAGEGGRLRHVVERVVEPKSEKERKKMERNKRGERRVR